MGLFDRLKAGLSRTSQQIVQRFDEIVRGADTPERRSRPVDVDTLDALEELLISADVGVDATERILDAVKRAPNRDQGLRELVRHEILGIFADAQRPVVDGQPQVTLVVGRQRHWQDDHGGKARQPGEARGTASADLRGGYVSVRRRSISCRSGRTARVWRWSARRTAPILPRLCSMPSASGKAQGFSPILVDTRGVCIRART
jgi:hypothetical protein